MEREEKALLGGIVGQVRLPYHHALPCRCEVDGKAIERDKQIKLAYFVLAPRLLDMFDLFQANGLGPCFEKWNELIKVRLHNIFTTVHWNPPHFETKRGRVYRLNKSEPCDPVNLPC